MAASKEHRPGRETTRALIERIAAGHLGAKLRSQVLAWHPGARREEVEEAFQEACLAAQRACRGESEGEVFTWLRTTTGRELGRLRARAARRSRLEVLVDGSEIDRPADLQGEPSPEQQLIEREDHAEAERVARAVLARLSDSQRAVAALHGRGENRPEIAAHLGMTPRSVKRALERILAIGRDELVQLAGHGCASGERLVARHAFGLATGPDAARAQLHLASCPRCGALYERLDVWREKVAALLPVPPVAETHAHVLERVIHAGGDALAAAREQPAAGRSLPRRHLADGVAQVRDHLMAAYNRVADPTPLAGVRPGAVAAAVAGCLAVGGGATYCATQRVDPIAGLSALAAPERHAPKAKPKSKPKPPQRRHHAARAPAPPPLAHATMAATATATPAARPTATATPVSRYTPQSSSGATAPVASTATPQAPSPAPQDEYEPSGGGTTASTAASSGAATTATSAAGATGPAPAPAGEASEFGGP